MSSIIASFVLAASVFTPQPSQVLLNPDTGAPKLEIGVLSAPLTGEPTVAVRTWAMSQREHWGLPAHSTLKFSEAFTTRFGASFHLQQMVGDVEVYQAKLVVTLDEKRQVVQVASSLVTSLKVVDGERMSNDQATRLAGGSVPLVAFRPDGVPYGGSKRFYMPVGDELHEAWVANVHSLDFSKNWYVAVDAVTGERLFMQNRVHHAAGDANVYPVSPGGLDAGVGATPTVVRSLTHEDGGSMIGDTCTTPLDDGGTLTFPNDAGELCGDQLMMFNCCPTKDCSTAPDAGPKRVAGTTMIPGVPIAIQYDVAVCDRMRRATNVGGARMDYAYTPVDPPTNRTAVVASDLANSDEFAEVHSFYHVNTVYDWMRKLSTTAAPIFGANPMIQPFKMRDEKRMPAVKVAVWSNVMFPNFNELVSGGVSCITNPPCRANTLTRIDNAAFFPREQFQQLPLPGFDTGADTLMIFQGNAADAAYDATVIQHEFGHGAVYATANISFDTAALDNRSANNESGALHEGFADYIAAAFNELAEVGPYFGPRVTAGQPMTPGVRSDQYLRSMTNTFACPEVLWGEVHEDSQHVAAALWDGRLQFGTNAANRERYDATFYAMLVSITPNADFAMVATTMAARVGTSFSSTAMASQQMTTIFMNRGVTGCSKVLDVNATNFPRPYYGIPSVSGFGTSPIPGPIQFRVPTPAGALRVRVTAVSGGGGGIFGGQPPTVRILAKNGMPITFARQGGVLQNDSTFGANMALQGMNLSGSVDVNSPCAGEVFITLSAAGGGATLQNVQVTVDPLMNCMIPVDGGTGGGGGMMDAGTGGGGGSTGTVTLISVGPANTTQQTATKEGCGCTSVDASVALMALAALGLIRRRKQS
ncbi:MAG: MYXO-CTERM sorting domain-containing protein [Archangium sp.]